MKVLVTGVTGQLGYDVCKVLTAQGIEHCGVGIADFDITDHKKSATYIKAYKPTSVIHCSAYTDVERAESEPGRCYSVNAEGTANMASVCNELGCKMVYLSTDYIFSGIGETPYEIDDLPAPLNVYGDSKLKGEIAVKKYLEKHFIVRASGAFGTNGRNFVTTMLHLGEKQNKVRVVADQVGSPTYTADLAILLVEMIKTEKYGIYHATNEGFCSWAEFAETIFKLAGYTTKVDYIKSEDYSTRVIRPKNSRLSKESLSRAGFNKLPTWQDALKRYVR